LTCVAPYQLACGSISPIDCSRTWKLHSGSSHLCHANVSKAVFGTTGNTCTHTQPARCPTHQHDFTAYSARDSPYFCPQRSHSDHLTSRLVSPHVRWGIPFYAYVSGGRRRYRRSTRILLGPNLAISTRRPKLKFARCIARPFVASWWPDAPDATATATLVPNPTLVILPTHWDF
jgi:hypothetical protein